MEPSRNGLLRLRLRVVFPCVPVAFSAPISKRGILLARLPVRHEKMCSCCCCCDSAIGAVICKIITTGIMDTHFDRLWGVRADIHYHCHSVSCG
jgi:hypothetical protein